jgi:hypothetical protein
MADSNDASPVPPAPPQEGPKAGQRPEALWPLAAVAATALVAVCGLALGLVLILGRGGNASGAGQSVQVNPVISIGAAPAAGLPAAASAPSPAPSGPRRGDAQPRGDQRDAAQDAHAVALPGALATPTPQGGQRERQLVRAETQAPPALAFPPPTAATPAPTPLPTPEAPRVYLRVRTVGGGPWDGIHALPMPIRASIDASGKAATVYAEHVAASATAQAAAPEVPYADTGAAQAGWDLQLSGVRKTGALDGYRAPAGFLFLTARLRAQNKGAQALALDGERFEVRDADGVRYLSIPELDFDFPTAPVAAGATAELTLSFLVLDAADLKSVALLTDAAPVLLPLTRK